MKILKKINLEGMRYVIPACRESFLKTQKECPPRRTRLRLGGQAAIKDISGGSGRSFFITHHSTFILQIRGFTLLEVLIALAIVGGLLVTLISTLNYHLRIVERQEAVTVATFLAKNKMASLETRPESTKGIFDAPYNDYTYETFLRESPYVGISEIGVIVKTGNEEVRLNEFVVR